MGCRGPSDAFIEKDAEVWLNSMMKVFSHMTDVPDEDINAAFRSPQISLFIFQFADYLGMGQKPRQKEKVV